MSDGGLKFSWGKKAAVTAVPKPARPGSTGMTIAQEAAVNQGDLKPTTPEEEEKRRKRLEAWKKLQAENPEAGAPADDDPNQKMAQVRAALKEVNKRNRDLGVRKSKKKRKRSSSSSDDVMITSTDNADVIITQADAKQRGGRGHASGAPAAGGLIDLDDEGPVDSEAKEQRGGRGRGWNQCGGKTCRGRAKASEILNLGVAIAAAVLCYMDVPRRS
eukprot:s3863_g8.t1